MNKIKQLYLILKSNGVSVEKFIKYLNKHVEEVKAFKKNRDKKGN